MQDAAMLGLYTDPSATYQNSCGTGNCTWPTFYTLGVCSTCTNVTTASRRSCANEGSAILCNYTTPAGYDLQYYNGYNQWTSIAAISGGNNLTAVSDTIVTTAILKQLTNDTPIDITDCTFSWCVKGFHNPSVTENVLDLSNVTEYQLSYTRLIKDIYQFTILDAPTAWNASIIWDVTVTDYQGTSAFLSSLFTTTNSDHVDQTALALYNIENIAERWEQMAESMTNAVRSGANASDVVGRELREETFIHVTWTWIILPVAVVLFAVTLVVLSILASKIEKKRLWKSSSMALLFARLPGFSDSGIEWRDINHMEKIAKDLEGTLAYDTGSYGLSFV